jgi:hypothetical protein
MAHDHVTNWYLYPDKYFLKFHKEPNIERENDRENVGILKVFNVSRRKMNNS